jgi:hypothetical protein
MFLFVAATGFDGSRGMQWLRDAKHFLLRATWVGDQAVLVDKRESLA